MAENNETETSTTPDNPEQALPESTETTDSTETTSPAMETTDLGQKIVDVGLGLVVLTGEVTVQAAKLIAEQGPEFVGILEAKGRPIREEIDKWLKDSFSQPFKVTVKAESSSAPETSAEEEISALERRVRDLEAQVSRSQSPEEVASPPAGPVLPDLDDEPVPTPEALPATSDATPAVSEEVPPVTDTTDSVAQSESLPPTSDTKTSDKEDGG